MSDQLRDAYDDSARGEFDYDEDFDDDSPRDCYWCAGTGWTDCADSIECTSVHNAYGECLCGSCGGSGDAKDMTIW